MCVCVCVYVYIYIYIYVLFKHVFCELNTLVVLGLNLTEGDIMMVSSVCCAMYCIITILHNSVVL